MTSIVPIRILVAPLILALALFTAPQIAAHVATIRTSPPSSEASPKGWRLTARSTYFHGTHTASGGSNASNCPTRPNGTDPTAVYWRNFMLRGVPGRWEFSIQFDPFTAADTRARWLVIGDVGGPVVQLDRRPQPSPAVGWIAGANTNLSMGGVVTLDSGLHSGTFHVKLASVNSAHWADTRSVVYLSGRFRC
jgi:hypothetical protein